MPSFEFSPHSFIEIQRPPCPKCGLMMWLGRIEPHDREHDKRTLECPVCEIFEAAIVKYK